MQKIDKTQCRKCLYRDESELKKTFACNYILLMNESRKCEPSPNCTKFEPYSRVRRKELTHAARITKDPTFSLRKKVIKQGDLHMTTERFEEIIEVRTARCLETLEAKADEYATFDRLHNFKVAAEIQNITPITALAGMMAKHTVSVYDLIQKHEAGLDIPLEMWNEKFGDCINYLLLLTALIYESSKTERKEKNDFKE